MIILEINFQDYHFFENGNEAINYLTQNKPLNTTILIKGSRGIKLEILIPNL